MTMDVTIAGITYLVDIDIDEEYVTAVFSVSVWDGTQYVELHLSQKELDKFYECYADDLNQAYLDEKIAFAECCAEEKWERQNDR